jgi:pimeloyl-ACP methyl ester carboxylesterase
LIACFKGTSKVPIVNRASLQVEYSDVGSGPTVVMLHSSVSGNRQWKRLIEELSPRYRCIAPNLLGYGMTSAWSADRAQTIDDAVQVLLAVSDQIPGTIRLVGHSWGGYVALAGANLLQDRVSHMVLYEPMLGGLLQGHNEREALSQAMQIYDCVRRFGDAGEWDSLAQVFTDYFNGDGVWDACPPERRRIIAAQLPPNRHEWDAGMQSTTSASFSRVTARTLILRGTTTRLLTSRIAQLLCGSFPAWQLSDVQGAGHMGPLTHPQTVNTRIAEFLDR